MARSATVAGLPAESSRGAVKSPLRQGQRVGPIGAAAPFPGNAAGGRTIDPATRTFQALRIAANDELESLASALGRLADCLRTGAGLAIISYHSLEDRLVKQAFRDDPRYAPLLRRPIRPKSAEVTRTSALGAPDCGSPSEPTKRRELQCRLRSEVLGRIPRDDPHRECRPAVAPADRSVLIRSICLKEEAQDGQHCGVGSRGEDRRGPDRGPLGNPCRVIIASDPTGSRSQTKSPSVAARRRWDGEVIPADFHAKAGTPTVLKPRASLPPPVYADPGIAG